MSDPVAASTTTREFLLEAVRAFAGLGQLHTHPTDLDWVQAAVADGVLAPVVHAMGVAGMSDLVPAPFDTYPSAVAARSMRSMQDLRLLGRSFDDGGIDWVTLKGPFLSDVVFRTPGVRDSVDLDLLVRAADVPRSLALLRDLGADVMGVDWRSNSWRRGAECPVVLRFGTGLDLHWHTVNRPMMRRRFVSPVEQMLSRRLRHDLRGVSLWTPDALDFVLHVLVHACLDGCARLRSVLDVHQCVEWLASAGTGPAALADRARETGVEVPALVALATTARVLDDDIGPWAEAMGPGTAWTRLASRMARSLPRSAVATPLTRKMNRHVTPTTTGSIAAVLHREVQRTESLLRRQPKAPVVEGITPSDDPHFERWLAYTAAQGATPR